MVTILDYKCIHIEQGDYTGEISLSEGAAGLGSMSLFIPGAHLSTVSGVLDNFAKKVCDIRVFGQDLGDLCWGGKGTGNQ
jgi:hypothetical protein